MNIRRKIKRFFRKFGKWSDASSATESVTTIFSRSIKRKMIYFDIEVTDCCNLNCKSCGSFAPLASKEFLDVDELNKDLLRLSELSSGVCHHINILGGEPLLHPEIERIITITRQRFPVGEINLVTNGTLLLKRESTFWNVCRECNITIAPTYYPVSVDYNAIEKKVREEKCSYKCYGKASECWFKTGLSEKNNFNETKRFLQCSNANNCSVLKNGKIYMCVKPAKVNLLNEAFGTDFLVMDNDYIDIYKAKSIDDIMEYLSNPIPFCRYCSEWKLIDWGISKKDKNEWID